MTDARRLLLDALHAALTAVDPARILPGFLPPPPRGRTLVVGGGKAAASMARAVEAHWPEGRPLSGLVVTRYRHGLPTRHIRVVEASHPLPDGRGEAAATRMLAMAGELGPDDLLLALVSGGGSSLLAAPVPGVPLKALRQVTKALLHSGAPIADINIVRKHLTRLSGGQLARAANGARVVALILSDVVGDDPADIASGPCAPDPSTYADAMDRLRHYRVDAPECVVAHLQRGIRGDIPDTPKPGDACFKRVRNQIIANNLTALDAACGFFRQRGVAAVLLSDRIAGDAEVAARRHAALLQSIACERPLALVSGGETTVRIATPAGHGGRNTHFLLALALALGEAQGVWALAADTDGIDGTEDNAGAMIGPDTLARARKLGLDAGAALALHDSYGFFAALGDLVVTGPTRTNVNDYRVLLQLGR
jgi:hydroxypyruvate reductase